MLGAWPWHQQHASKANQNGWSCTLNRSTKSSRRKIWRQIALAEGEVMSRCVNSRWAPSLAKCGASGRSSRPSSRATSGKRPVRCGPSLLAWHFIHLGGYCYSTAAHCSHHSGRFLVIKCSWNHFYSLLFSHRASLRMNSLVAKGSVIVIVGANLDFPVIFLLNSAKRTFEHTACPTSGPNTLGFAKCGACCCNGAHPCVNLTQGFRCHRQTYTRQTRKRR